MDPEVWEYRKAVCELEKTHEEMKKKRRAEKSEQEQEEAQQLADVQCRVSELDDPVNSQVRNKSPCMHSLYQKSWVALGI